MKLEESIPVLDKSLVTAVQVTVVSGLDSEANTQLQRLVYHSRGTLFAQGNSQVIV